MDTGQRIKARRKELGISADKLAEAIGKDRSTIFRYEKGDIDKLPIDILEPIAKALKTTPAALMGWEEMQKNNDIIANAVVRMRSDEVFLTAVHSLYVMDAEKLKGLLAFLK